MILESLINFKRGQYVQLNPYKIPYGSGDYGRIILVETKKKYLDGIWKDMRTGKISVEWESGVESVHYSTLRIAPDDVQFRLRKDRESKYQKKLLKESI